MYLVEDAPKYQVRFAKKAHKDIAELTEQQKARISKNRHNLQASYEQIFYPGNYKDHRKKYQLL